MLLTAYALISKKHGRKKEKKDTEGEAKQGIWPYHHEQTREREGKKGRESYRRVRVGPHHHLDSFSKK